MADGRLVILEGIDGAGKSTASAAVAHALRQRGLDVVETREPTDTDLGEAVRSSLGDDAAHPGAEAFLFMADHAAHVDRIRDLLAGRPDRVVVSDRYADSCYAYQGVLLEEALADHGVDDPVAWLRSTVAPFHRDPDVAILLDVPIEEALDRVDARGDAGKFERARFLERVRANYLRLADELPYYEVVDAAGAPDDVQAAAREAAATALEA